MKSTLTILALLLSCSLAHAQTPGMVHVMLPDGNSFVESQATSGTMTVNGFTCTWDVGESSASILFSGPYSTTWVHPKIDIAWFNTTAPMQVVAQIGCGETTYYDFRAPYIQPGGSWQQELSQSDLSGGYSFDHTFPSVSRMDVEISPQTPGETYDMSTTLTWGAGVEVEGSSFGRVKSLF